MTWLQRTSSLWHSALAMKPPTRAEGIRAGAIFLLDCGVIAFTTLDGDQLRRRHPRPPAPVNRSLQTNGTPVTPEQQQAFEHLVEESRRKSGAR